MTEVRCDQCDMSNSTVRGQKRSINHKSVLLSEVIPQVPLDMAHIVTPLDVTDVQLGEVRFVYLVHMFL